MISSTLWGEFVNACDANGNDYTGAEKSNSLIYEVDVRFDSIAKG
jgi:hypothetical protein